MIKVPRARRLGALALAILAASCGGLTAPFEGVPSLEPPPGISADSQRVAVCYNKRFTTPEQVRAVAVEACGPDSDPQLIGQDVKLDCPVMTPVRAQFLCTPE
jgi:hypothetical protein